ncbi:hypothetical protein [Gayadomonas joobiniege]|uniref:hypothetical protein n=1 Tax=Gayadomonas joobiniege TaxID=1234606 RepID=UPI000376168C|nr:hypothetical protein [Gayadomonas joobiniege]
MFNLCCQKNYHFRRYLGALFLLLTTSCHSLLAHQIELKTNELKQKIDIVGGDMERSADFLFEASNPEQILDWYFKDINMPYWRVVIDKHQEMVEGKTNFEFYNKQISVMKKIRARQPNVKFWATLKTDYDGYGDKNNMPDWVYTGRGYNGGEYQASAFKANKWARFLADYLKLMDDNGVSIEILSVSKEWMQVMTADNEKNTIVELKRLLTTPKYDGVPVPQFNGPAAWGVKQAVNFVNQVAEKGYDDLYTGFSAHTYDKPSPDDWQRLIAAANKINLPVYNEENNAGGGGPYHGAQPSIEKSVRVYAKKAPAYQAGLKGELFFELWSRGYSRESRSVYFNKNEAGSRGRGYWLSQLFINNVYNKHYVAAEIDSDLSKDIKVMAFADKEQAIVYLMNTSDKNSYHGVKLKLAKPIPSQQITQRLWAKETQLQGNTTQFNVNKSSLISVDLVAPSITVLLFKL